MKKAALAVVMVVAGLLAGFSAELRAANCVWQGEMSKDWSDAGNWSNGTVPAEKDNVYIKAASECALSADTKVSLSIFFVGLGGSGSASINGENSSLTALSIAVGAYGAKDGSGVLTQNNGSITCSNSMSVGSRSGMAKYKGVGGKLKIIKHFSIGGRNSKGTFVVEGANVSADKNLINGSGKINKPQYGHGVVNITSGSLKVAGGFYNAHHMYSTFSEDKKVYGKLRMSGGKLEVAGDFYNGFGSKSEKITKVEGIVEIVGNDGKFIVKKNFIQGKDSFLIAEITGEKHTLIQVKGQVELGGIFKVRLADGYTPDKETWWDIIRGNKGSPVGTFAKLDFSETANPDNWTVSYDTEKCVFQVGYIPATK